jgi:hypothetical protein
MNKFWQQTVHWISETKREIYCWWKGICPIHGEIDRNGPNWTKDSSLVCPKCQAAASLPLRLDNMLNVLRTLRALLFVFGVLCETTFLLVFVYWFVTHQDKVEYTRRKTAL